MKLKRIAVWLVTMAFFVGIMPYTLCVNAEESGGGVDVLRNIFSDINEENPDEKKDDLPYRSGTMLSDRREPLTAYKGKTYIYGENNDADELSLSHKEKSVYPRIKAGEITVGSRTLNISSEIQLLKSYEGNFNGNGKKDELAVIVGAKTKDGRPLLLLCTAKADFSAEIEPIAVLYEGSSGIDESLFFDSFKWSNSISIVCADLNGDGYDEIVTTSPTSGYTDKQSGDYGFDNYGGSYIWYLEENHETSEKTGWCENPVEPYNGLDTYKYECYIGAPGVVSSMAAADVDGDGYDDLITAISTTSARYSSGYVNNHYALYIIKGTPMLDTIYANKKHIRQYMSGTIIQDLYFNFKEGDAAGFDVTTADIDGTGRPTIFMSMKKTINNYAGQSVNNTSYTPEFYVYAFDYNKETDGFVSSCVYKGGIYHHGWVEPRLDTGETEYVYKTKPEDCAPIRIGVLKDDFALSNGKSGYVSSGTLIVDQKYISFVRYANGDTYRYDTKDNGSYTGVWGTADKETIFGYKETECIRYNNGIDVMDIRTAAVSKEEDAALVLARTGNGVKTYFLNSRGKEYPVNNSNAVLCRDNGYGTLIAMPDTDNDSIYLKYNRHKFFWSDPVIVAALASPPYFGALPSENYTNSQTTYGKTISSSTGQSNSFTVGAGAYVSTEIKGGALDCSGVFEYEGEAMRHSTLENEKNIEVSYTQSFATSGGEDTVVLSTVGYDAYEYTAYYPGADGTVKTTPYIVYVPRGGTSSVKIASLNYEDYLELIPYANTALPRLEDVFTHKVGKPETYPHAEIDNFNIVRNSIMTYPNAAAFPSNAGSQTLAMDITEETTSVTSTGSEVTAKIGGGYESEADDIFGLANMGVKITAGSISEKAHESGKITANAVGTSFEGTVFGQNDGMNVSGSGLKKADFNWRLMRYVYNSNPSKSEDVRTQEFPVITYITSGVTQPEGVIPTSVTVSPSSATVQQVGPSTPGYKSTASFSVKAEGVSRESHTSLEGAPLGMTLETSGNVGTGNAFPFGVSINGNVQPGTYDVRLNIGGVLSDTFTITVTEYVSPKWLKTDKSAIDFGSMRQDYAGKLVKESQEITVTNINTSAMSNITTVLSEDSAFEVSKALPGSISAGGSETVSVKPKNALMMGTYTDTLTITNGDVVASVLLSCTVTEPGLPGKPNMNIFPLVTNPITINDAKAPEDDGGAQITDYLYTVKDHMNYLDENGEQIWKSTGNRTQSGYVTFSIPDELEVGSTYGIGLKAVNTCGIGEAAWGNIVIASPPQPPNKVRNVKFYPDDKKIHITWDEPDYWGETELAPEVLDKSYFVYLELPNHSEYTIKTSERQFTFEKYSIGTEKQLENGVEYGFRITAFNYVKESEAVSFKATPNVTSAAPSRPNNLTVETSYRTAVLKWDIPLYQNGITRYEASKDGGKTWVNVGTAKEYTFNELTTNLEHTFAVRAVNSVGAGDNAIIKATPPSNLAKPSLSYGNTYIGYEQVDIGWYPEIENVPTGYEFKLGNGEWQKIETVKFGECLHYVVTGLTNGTEYDMYIRPYNDEGPGPELKVSRTPSEEAAKPLKNARVEPRRGGMAFYAENQDDRYGMQYSVEGGRWWTFSSGYRLNGFENGKTYTVALGYDNEHINGWWAHTVTYLTVTPSADIPDPPSEPLVEAVVGDNYIDVEWNVADNGGSEILKYILSYQEGYGSEEEQLAELGAEQTSYRFETMPEVMENNSLRFYVTAVNAVGESRAGDVYIYQKREYIKGQELLALNRNYTAVSTESFLLFEKPRYDPEASEKDVSGEYEWNGVSDNEKIRWNGETRKFDIEPGLPEGIYTARAQVDMYGYKLEKIVTITVCDKAKIAEVKKGIDCVTVSLMLPPNTEKASVTAAVYDASGKLTDIEIKNITAETLGNGTFTLPINPSGAKNAKIMLAESAENMKPLCKESTLNLE